MLDSNASTICPKLTQKERNLLRGISLPIPDERNQVRPSNRSKTCAEVHLLGTHPKRILDSTWQR